ncbi:MAG: disulfide bond formation protein B, partial [Betaproteobacteria bacterium]|nr:disulfide bond formation protein B [Betaproteobacteria bacterium]
DLYYMIDHFPLGKVVANLFRGSGQCAEVTWRFLGLSIAEWSLLCFALIALSGLAIAADRHAGQAR